MNKELKIEKKETGAYFSGGLKLLFTNILSRFLAKIKKQRLTKSL